jgi:outer membrane protein assembly factor BamB
MRFLILLTSVFLMTGCSDMWFGDNDDAPPLPGQRLSVLELQKKLQPDEDVETLSPFAQPAIWANEYWPQAGGYPHHAMQNLAFGSGEVKKIWRADIGDGTTKGYPLTAQPVVVDGKVFTLDSQQSLAAFDATTGNNLWRVSVSKEKEDDAVISGGLSFSGGKLYVTSGYNELLAVSPADGKIIWRSPLSAPSRAAPTILDGRVFVTLLSNSMIAFNAESGALLWEYAGMGEATGLIGGAAPAADGNIVIPAFTSGEIYALRVENGAAAWSDSLSNVLRLGGLSGVSDIRGMPVIDKNMVIAISYGGKMVAIDILSGQRIWQRDIGGSETPWVAGSRVFIISTQNEVVSLDRETGAIMWVSQLARYKDKEAKAEPIFWTGPVMAAGRLMAFSSDARAAEINPENGTLLTEWSTGESVRIAPVIAGGTLYLLAR